MNSKFYQLLLAIPLLMFTAVSLNAQFSDDDEDDDWYREESKFYFSGGGEMIFSWSNTTHPTSSDGVILRWAPVFNMQGFANYDFGRGFGIFGGLALRNVGYIYDFNDVDGQQFKKKFRTYNIGVPLGIKVGNVNGFHVYGGYTFDFPFHYKEKTFDTDGSKINKFTSWFTDRVEPVQHGFFAGIQFKEGLNLKFQMYLTEFHNQDFSITTDEGRYPPSGDATRPYDGLESYIMYISISSIVSKKNYSYYKPPRKR